MADVADFSIHRWERGGRPDEHEPSEAVDAAQRDLAEGKMKTLHAFVVIAHEGEDGSVRTRFYQAGSYNRHGQIGLLHRAILLSLEP